MIYVKGDGTESCSKVIQKYIKEMSSFGDSVFDKGEQIQELKPGELPVLDKKDGTKLIDFSFLHDLIANKVVDVNKIDCYDTLHSVLSDITTMSKEIEYCILIPDVERNDAVSVRSKLYQELKIKTVGEMRLGKAYNSYLNTYRTNPYLFQLNERNVALLSLDKPITTKLKEELNG